MWHYNKIFLEKVFVYILYAKTFPENPEDLTLIEFRF